MKLLVINNMQSGFGDGSVYDFIRAFSNEDDEIVIRNVRHTSSVGSKLRDAANFDMVIAAGGDRTVSNVSYSLANTNIPILAHPSGTFNIIATNLMLPNEPHALAKVAKEKKTLKFDLGEITCNGKKFGFGSYAGAGYDAKISKEAKPTKKNLGPLAYIGAAITNFKPTPANFDLELDGKKIKSHGVGIMLMNFAKIGLELSVTHANRPRDGKLDVVILKAKTALSYIPALTAAALDNAIEFPDRSKALEIYQASDIKISADTALELQTDGAPLELKTPFEAHVIKQAATYVLSEEGLETYNK